jgi:hypothetical protein
VWEILKIEQSPEQQRTAHNQKPQESSIFLSAITADSAGCASPKAGHPYPTGNPEYTPWMGETEYQETIGCHAPHGGFVHDCNKGPGIERGFAKTDYFRPAEKCRGLSGQRGKIGKEERQNGGARKDGLVVETQFAQKQLFTLVKLWTVLRKILQRE